MRTACLNDTTLYAGLLLAATLAAATVACQRNDEEAAGNNRPERTLATPIELQAWREVEDLPEPIAQFETVFWEPRDTESLRQWIRTGDRLRDRRVLEIGTGTGLLALCCLEAGARFVVATDINPAAIANAAYNAENRGVAERLELRLVQPSDRSAFSIIGPEEQFDLIISNPPWEDSTPQSLDEYALYDENFLLLDTLLEGTRAHLTARGRALLAYGHRQAIERILERAPDHGLQVKILDDRPLDSLPDNFLPGMLLEITPISS